MARGRRLYATVAAVAAHRHSARQATYVRCIVQQAAAVRRPPAPCQGGQVVLVVWVFLLGSKPSLKIRTASAIFWIYLGIFKDNGLKNICFRNKTFLFFKIEI